MSDVVIPTSSAGTYDRTMRARDRFASRLVTADGRAPSDAHAFSADVAALTEKSVGRKARAAPSEEWLRARDTLRNLVTVLERARPHATGDEALFIDRAAGELAEADMLGTVHPDLVRVVADVLARVLPHIEAIKQRRRENAIRVPAILGPTLDALLNGTIDLDSPERDAFLGDMA